MRLLVYGGNQYSERRRIGDWPEVITGQVLQNKYGVSELYAAFGVGLLDESPFLIYRVMQVHNQRSYPLTLLLDPGTRVWEKFDWNGAALMLALFGAVESPGRPLLQEPERYHSTEHLETLFESVERKETAGAEGPAAQLFLRVWAGTVLEASPVVVGPSEELVGLDSRPSLQEMPALLKSLPPSLRCGRGWLMGGNAGYAAPFGVRLIFDNGKNTAGDSDEAKQLLAVRERGAKFRGLLQRFDTKRSADRGDDLDTLTRRPVFLWEKHLSHTFESVVADINLLMALDDEALTTDAPSIRRTDALDEKFRKVNDRLAERGPLSDSIAATADGLILDDTGTLTRQQTFFVLDRVMKSRAKKIDKSIEPRIDKEAAFEFFVGRRIYPSVAGARMPEPLRTAVCRRLVETESDAGDLPQIIGREAPHVDRDGDDLRGLVGLAVRLSGASERGLGIWRPFFDDEEIGQLVIQHVQTYARVGLNEINNTTLGNYLHFGADGGGRWLGSRFDDEDDAETVDVVINFLLEELRGNDGDDAQRKASDWLTKLAHTELRPRVRIDEKIKIAGVLAGGWANLLLLEKAFRGKEPEKKRKKKGEVAAGPDADERRYLARELHDLASRHEGARLDFVPDIERLHSLVGPEHLGDIVDSLSRFAPPLSGSGAERWVEGWRTLSEAADNEELIATCREKHREELVRLLLDSPTAAVSSSVVAKFNEPVRLRLLQGLLCGGDEESDVLRRAKLVGLLKEGKLSDAVRDSLRGAYDTCGADATKREALLRRYGRNSEAFGLLQKVLAAPDAEELGRWLEQKNGEELKQTAVRLGQLLSSTCPEEYYESLSAEKRRVDNIDKTYFKRALNLAFADVFEANGDADPTVFDAPNEALGFIRRHLSDENVKRLDATLDARARSREALSFERLLYEPAEDNVEARRSLNKVLKSPSSAVEDILGAAIEKGLAEARRREIMFHRLFPPGVNFKEKRPELLTVTEILFKHLPDTLQDRFVQMLFQHHGGDKNVDKSEFVAATHGVFNDLRREVENHKSDGPKLPKVLKGRPFSDALLRFVKSNDAAKCQIGTWTFAESWKKIDDYLSDYPHARPRTGAQITDDDDADGDETMDEADPKESVGRRLKRFFLSD